MKVIVEALNSPSVWRYPQTTGIVLRIYANSPFLTYHGQYVPAGSPKSPNSFYLEVLCEIQGGNILYIPSFEIDSTEDSPTDRAATYTAWFFAGEEQIGAGPFLPGFAVPAAGDALTGLGDGQTWAGLILHRDSLNPPPRQGVYDIGQVEYLISNSLGLLRFASMTQVGMVALQNDPVDPVFPIALGPNSPGVGSGSGLAALVGGIATVLTNLVTAASKILLTGQDENVSGALRVGTRVNGVSFEIVSDNGADSGFAAWMILN